MKSTQITHSFLVFLVSLLTLTVSTTPADAQTAPTASYAFTVNTTTDTHDAHPGDGVCADSMGQCSLRAAIEEADALPMGSSITLTVPAGTYALTLGTLGLTAQHTITINGAGSTSTIMSGNKTFEIMSVSSSVNASLNGLTIEGGKGQHGGGITNNGTLSLDSSTVSGNTATYGGGGIWNDHGTLSLSNNSTVSGNSARFGGGGIKNDGGMLTVSNSTISGNSAGHGHNGGGIFNGLGKLNVNNSTVSGNSAYSGAGIYNVGMLNVTNSTISNNLAGDGGGIMNYIPGTLSVSNSTISGNSASDGGGIYNYYAYVSVINSTIAGNSFNQGTGISTYGPGTITLTGTIVANSTASNCYGPITEGVGYNLDIGTLCGFKLKTDLNNTNPKLGPLGDNGGPTQTMALRKGSKAIDWVAATAVSRCPATDQRGYMRPDTGESTCDIGAYESAY